MVLNFTKMSGAGNDFILIDDRNQQVQLTPERVARICDRHRGVGGDGLVLLRPCVSGKADWAWGFYNSDGSVAEMCGNAARCFGRFVERQTGSHRDFTFETVAGVISAHLAGELVEVNLTEPSGLKINEVVRLPGGDQIVHSVDTGVPHAVVFVADADKAMVDHLGRELRWHRRFQPRGTNVNFVQELGPSYIRVRTFERGVEAETLACGTGVTASALISSRLKGFRSPIKVQVKGKEELEVSFEEAGGDFTRVRLTGPADFVFEGKMEI